MPILPDILNDGVRLLICGYNPGPQSARNGHYFFNPTHRFWTTINEVGLTPRVLSPYNDRELPKYGIGLTDLMKESTHGDGRMPTDHDRNILCAKVERYKPEFLVLLGKKTAKGFLGLIPDWGFMTESIEGTKMIMAPDPSPANGHFRRLMYVWWEVASAMIPERQE